MWDERHYSRIYVTSKSDSFFQINEMDFTFGKTTFLWSRWTLLDKYGHARKRKGQRTEIEW